MIIDYRLANADDLNEIVSLVENAVTTMESNSIYQWDALYPTREDFGEDIEKRNLYVGMMEGKIAVIVTLNQECDEEYENGVWRHPDRDYYSIHRLCVNPFYQNKGVGRKTMLYIEESLRTMGIQAVRLDVFSENPYALNLYTHMGYSKVGYVDWRKGRLYCLMSSGLSLIFLLTRKK